MHDPRTTAREGSEEVGTALQALLDRVVARRRAPHALLAVASVDGAFGWAGAAGAAHPDGEPMRVDTPFHVASVTKLYTAVGLMQERWNRIHFPFEYGLGMLRFRMPRAMSPAYAIPPLVGHHGASGSWLYHCPDLDLLLAGTLDQAARPSLPYRLLPRVLRVLSRRLR